VINFFSRILLLAPLSVFSLGPQIDTIAWRREDDIEARGLLAAPVKIEVGVDGPQGRGPQLGRKLLPQAIINVQIEIEAVPRHAIKVMWLKVLDINDAPERPVAINPGRFRPEYAITKIRATRRMSIGSSQSSRHTPCAVARRHVLGSVRRATERCTQFSALFPRSGVGTLIGDAPRPPQLLVSAKIKADAERRRVRSHAGALVIPEKLVSWLAEIYQHAHGWSQLCSHGRQFTGPRQRNGLAHSSRELGSAIARGGNGSWRLRRLLPNSLAS
jgi:hypothetical protein